uniref:Protein TsetseEP domain-containing protein n=1 Tax=Anopheles farauti TaxID=69004 RepID=A0A182Q1G7_9DIPT
MKVFCFTLTILCIVQSILAIPRPDFGLNGAVYGSGTLNNAATDLDTESTKIGAYSVTLTSGYTLLTTISDALTAIGDDITTAAKDLATQLNTFSDDGSGQVTAAFDAVSAKITAYKTLVNGAFGGNIASISTNTGQQFIENQLKDAFKAVTGTLDNLSGKLALLKTEVNNAKTNGGSGATVSSAVVRRYVNARTVNDVTVQIRNLKSNTPLMTFVINSALDNLKMVDDFIIDLKAGVDDSITLYDTTYDAFSLNLQTEAEDINTALTIGVGSSAVIKLTSIQSTLDGIAEYTSDLAPKIAQLNTAVTDTVTAKKADITTAFATYATNANTLIPDLKASLGNMLCKPIQSVSIVQIVNHGYSDFCFSKYSPRVYAQIALTIDAFDVCFMTEISRLISLVTVIEKIGVQISYDTEDLYDNLNGCLSLPVSAQGSCFTAIAPYYQVVAAKAAANLATATSLVTAETTASYNRLGSCLYASLYVTALSATEIVTAAEGCLTTGPQP